MSDDAGGRLFFGTGTGRCGTMTLSNALSAEPGVRCLHEGKRRRLEEAGEQHLSFLTLQNLAAYHRPDEAEALFREHRAGMESVRTALGVERLGDVAYNYAPFVGVIPAVLPAARLVVVVRDGRDFVRSATTDEVPDPTPVGWPPASRTERPTREERFIALGRLRPRPEDPLTAEWPGLSAVARNAWLWAETNRLIEDGLAAWAPERVLRLRFEELPADPVAWVDRVRSFLGLGGPMPDAVRETLARPINRRTRSAIGRWAEWPQRDRDDFRRLAGAMMERLGYDVDGAAQAP